MHMTRARQDLDLVRDYYTSPRPTGQVDKSIYDIWETGGAFNDSITPSTYVPEYRSHIVLKILSLTSRNSNIFSFGCGNGFVEAELVNFDRWVRAIDCNEAAVKLTRKKGVEAYVADFFMLQPEDMANTDVVYADGLLGHLFDPDEEIVPALSKIESLNLKSGARLVFSNDSPRDMTAAFAPHERVAGFWFLSKDYLRDKLSSFGFETTESYYFPYCRPISGLRNRTICIASVP
jgi:SAM-dependent methyltransferase